MDDAAVRTAAEEHAHATVQKDFKVAGATLTETARGQAGGVMKAMPGELTGYEITGVNAAGAETTVTIAYRGDKGETTVVSRWAEVDGRPMIVDLSVH
jgi:hypothetical protein